MWAVLRSWNPIRSMSRAGHPLGDTVPSAGYIQEMLLDIQEMLLLKKGPPSRKVLPGGMGCPRDPKPSGFSTAVRRTLSQLTMSLFE